MTAGYSGTPLPQKLGIKPGHRVAVIDAPRSAMSTIAELAGGAGAPIDLKLTGREPYNVILLFCESQWALSGRFEQVRARLAEDGGLWIAWAKQSSGVKSDLNENIVRDVGLAAGLVDNKVCAIDETWSGLRLVVRVENRRIGPAKIPGGGKKSKKKS